MTRSSIPDTSPLVLILTHSDDHYVIDLVHAALGRLGADVVRVNLDRYPTDIAISAAFNSSGVTDQITIDGRTLDASLVRAVWVRHLWPPTMDARLDPRFRDGCVRNAITARDGFLDSMEGARWINRPEPLRQAFNKLHQLRLAHRIGLRIPRTLVTNSPDEVRMFYDSLGGQIVGKVLVNLSASMGHATFFVRTTPITPAHIQSLEGLRHSPMIFQERIPKVREFRVAYVAGETFTGAITAPDLADWRMSSVEDTQWQPGRLPDETVRSIRELMDALGLEYGAIDFIESNSGAPVFLEVNPTGEWGMLQKYLDLPIANAIATALLRKDP